MNPRYIVDSDAKVPDGMMATRKMDRSMYRKLEHDRLMGDPVRPTIFNSRSTWKVTGAWFIKDGIRSVLKLLSAKECTAPNRAKLISGYVA